MSGWSRSPVLCIHPPPTYDLAGAAEPVLRCRPNNIKRCVEGPLHCGISVWSMSALGHSRHSRHPRMSG
jgi:hypothetical protein